MKKLATNKVNKTIICLILTVVFSATKISQERDSHFIFRRIHNPDPYQFLNEFLGDADYNIFLAWLNETFDPTRQAHIVSGIASILKSSKYQELPLKFIFLPLISALLDFHQADIDEFLEKFAQILEHISIFALSKKKIPYAYWKDTPADAISALFRILAKEIDIEYYKLVIGTDNKIKIKNLGNKSLDSFYSWFRRNLRNNPEVIMRKFPHLTANDMKIAQEYVKGKNYLIRQALKINPATTEEWIARIRYLHEVRNTQFGSYELPDEVMLDILLLACREVYFKDPAIVQRWKLDYYHENQVPYYRLNEKMIELLPVPFLGNVTIYKMIYEKYGGVEALRKYYPEIFYPSLDKPYRWVDRIRMMKTYWEEIPRKIKNEVLWKFALRLAQEKKCNVTALTLGQWEHVKFLRYPGHESTSIARAFYTYDGNWEEFYHNVLLPHYAELEEEIKKIDESLAKGERINWELYQPWEIREWAYRKFLELLRIDAPYKLTDKEILEIESTIISNSSLYELLISSIFVSDFQLFKAMIFVDFYLKERIKEPLNTSDYILSIFYNYSHNIWYNLPDGVRREIDKMWQIYRQRHNLMHNDYLRIPFYLIVKEDPLNLLSPADQLMIEIALQDRDDREYLKNMTLFHFYKQQ